MLFLLHFYRSQPLLAHLSAKGWSEAKKIGYAYCVTDGWSVV